MKRKLIIMILVVVLSTGFLSGCSQEISNRYEVSITKNGIVRFHSGYLYTKFGVPFLYLKGNPYEMGLQYGVLLKKSLNSVYLQLDHLEKSIFRNLPVYLKPLTVIFVFVKLIFIKRSLSEEFKEELKGISDGSGISYNKLLFVSMIPEIFNFSCTSFVKIVNGRLIHGRNLDYYFPMIGKNPLIVRYNPEGKIPYTLVGCVGYTGAYTGMNDYGITVTVNAAPITRSSNTALPITFQVRRILENAKDLSDVEKLFNNYRSIKGWMVTVGSAREKSAAVFNVAGSEISETKMSNEKIFVTNTFIDKSFAHKYMALSDAESPSSVLRFERMSHLINKIDSVESAINALADYKFYSYGNTLGAGDVTLNNEGSLQSVVMDPVNHLIYFSSDGMYSGFYEFIKADSRFSGSPAIYREADSDVVNSPEFKEFSKWFENAEIYYLEGDYKRVFKLANAVEYPNLIQIEGEENVAEKLSILKKDKGLIKKANYLIKKYPDYIVPYLIKAKVLFASKQYQETVNVCDAALKTKIKTLFLEAEAYSLLARSYENMENDIQAKKFAKLTLNIINQYARSKKELKMLAEIEKILNR